MSEGQFQQKITRGMEKCNALVFAFAGSRFQKWGIPDTFICHRYWQGWIEFKGERTRLHPIQAVTIKRLKERGTPAYVVRAPNKVENEKGKVLFTFETPLDLIKKLRDHKNGGFDES